MLNTGYKPLKRGDRIAVLVASSPIDESHMRQGHHVLTDLGLNYSDEHDALFGEHYLSKAPQDRANILVRFLNDDNIDAVWLARGGYGANLILPCLVKTSPPSYPKPIFGSSDGCYLLWTVMEKWGLPVFLAPMIYASMTQEAGYDPASLKWALFGEGGAPCVRGQSLDNFSAFGLLHGGCLSILVSLIQTPFMPNLSGTLLIIEDINERPYRLERMMWQLLMSGSLKGVNAILFGQFPACFKDQAEKKHFYGRMAEMLGLASIPFAFDFALGHAKKMITVPLGVKSRLDVSKHRAHLSFENFMSE